MSPDLDLLEVHQKNKIQTHMWPHDFDLLQVDEKNKMQTHICPPI